MICNEQQNDIPVCRKTLTKTFPRICNDKHNDVMSMYIKMIERNIWSSVLLPRIACIENVNCSLR